MAKVYIGIDPDIRVLSAAIITEDSKPLAVLVRKNKEGKGDGAIVSAAEAARRLADDVIQCLSIEITHLLGLKIVLVVETQSMQHTRRARAGGAKINYDDIRRLATVTGCLLGAFSGITPEMYLVQPTTWKGTVPKHIAHRRYYSALGIKASDKVLKSCIYPEDTLTLCKYSVDKINNGDFADINDSLGLALYGAKKRL